MAKYGMAIDLHKCMGCGACALACKTENNTEFEQDGRKYNWADFFTHTEGTFAQGDVKYKVLPVLCNHCTDAPCVAVCPVTPKAMYKTDDGITMHNDDLCIGCQLCQTNCPYSSKYTIQDGVQYSVISFNPSGQNTQGFYDDETAIIPGGTSTPAEIVQLAGVVPPDKNKYTHPDIGAVRPSGVTEKCIFCDHRLQNGEQPYCVVSCPTGARIFGDLNDPNSEISVAIAGGYSRLKNNLGEMLPEGQAGTSPNVYYLNDFNVGVSDRREVKKINEKLKVYPNPTSGNTTAEFEINETSEIHFSIYDISGKEVLKVMDGESMPLGKHKVHFDVSDFKTGTYIGRLTAGGKAFTANILVVK
ncbi:MAG: 4Fe-4S dicluster domain-containing protein [Chlorobi bacterium]|nr:4Fe-4S dicluster domain-containing protein [Chlorobiota bacterium]